MAKRCPPGVLCIENMTLVIAVVILLVIAYVFYLKHNVRPAHGMQLANNMHSANGMQLANNMQLANSMQLANNMHSANGMQLANSMQLANNMQPTAKGVPINVPTQSAGQNSTPTQVGILTGNGEILPLIGSQIIASRDTWHFHTKSNQRSQVMLPISFKGKSCTSEYGCDNLSNGDTVYVEGYNKAFKVTMYDKRGPQYIPYV